MDNDFNTDALKQDIPAPPADPNNPPAPPADPNNPPAPPADPNNPPAPPAPPADPNNPPAPPADPNNPPAPPADPNNPPAPPADPNNPPAPPTPPAETPEQLRQKMEQEFYARFGVKNAEELQAKLTPPKVETPEEKEARERAFQADLDAWAVKEGKVTKDDIVALETMKKADKVQLVQDAFVSEFKKNNEGATDAAAQAAFRAAYHLDSENAGMKAHGEQLVQQQATKMIGELQSKYDTAKADYTTITDQKAKVPAFKQFVQQSISQYVPSSMPLIEAADGEEAIALDLSAPEVRKEVEKFLANNHNFGLFLEEGSTPQSMEHLRAQIEGYLFQKNKAQILNTVYQTALARGMKKGSTTGSTAPFGKDNPPPPAPIKEGVTAEDDAKTKNLFG